jgi:membrane protein DedA with SNARE-associated domain
MPEILNFIQDGLASQSGAGLFIVFLFGTFISEDAACLLAGTAVANGRISFGLAILACLVGIFVGDILLYGAGRLLGMAVFSNRLVSKLVSNSLRERATDWLQKNAASAVFVSRFVSGLRLPTYLAAGALRAGFTKFAFLFLVASVIWTPILVGSTAFAQQFIFRGSSILGIVAIFLTVRIALKFSSWKNRRLFVGRVKRIVNWEFWPLPVFYFPIVLYIFFLAIRFRGFTLFTSANPGVPAGGFVGESKDDIYTRIVRSPKAKQHVLRHIKIKSSLNCIERLVKTISFLQKNRLTFPLILKPDKGERGAGVTLIHNKKELGLLIRSAENDMILQEFCPGVEASIFYYRFPDERSGRIFSITEKIFPNLAGDGKATIEELILSDKRAVCMVKSYFDQQRDCLQHVPNKGENVSLIDIGTHSMGAIFHDGRRLKTAELEQTIDLICRGIDGFYFGRFDVRAASFDELKAGKFKIIELNGVTSESTNIYDSRFSLIGAYRILFQQWKLAFMIGEANRKRGVEPLSVRQLAKLIKTRDASFLAAAAVNDKIAEVSVSRVCA